MESNSRRKQYESKGKKEKKTITTQKIIYRYRTTFESINFQNFRNKLFRINNTLVKLRSLIFINNVIEKKKKTILFVDGI